MVVSRPRMQRCQCRFVHSENHRRPLRRGIRCQRLELDVGSRLKWERWLSTQLPPGFCLDHTLKVAGVPIGRRGMSAPRCLKKTRRGTPCQKPRLKMPDGRFSGACEKHGGATFRGKRGTGLTQHERRAKERARRAAIQAQRRAEWWARL
jgi:hypothetical protein